jgi:HD-GYP domain-containing protein (c-di-GMP phosphodiesterase class II)
MPIISVSQLKTGEVINQDVFTERGGILFEKGKTITEKEIDILKAFLIPSVSVDVQQGEEQPKETVRDQSVVDRRSGFLEFYGEYNQMIALLKRVFNLAAYGGAVPILEVRNRLISLLSLIDHYNVLTFSPRNMVSSDYIYHNSVMVGLTAHTLAKWNGFAQKDLIPIALAGLFHDIGNAKVDPVILSKPSRLTGEEREEIKRHTIYGYNYLKTVPAINDGVKLAALQHHEKEDGSGYPMAVKGDKIHIYAKLVAIADIYHAATSPRLYKKSDSPYLVLEQISKEAFGKLDPILVQTFVQKVTQFHNGTVVKLNDGSIGEIVFSDRMNPTRPWVNVNGKIINLVLERSKFIKEVVR